MGPLCRLAELRRGIEVMPPANHQPGLIPSLIDRLIDPESSGTAIMSGYSPEKMFQAVLRDLEDLLNTRRTVTKVDDHYDEVSSSIVTYGLPDISSIEAGSSFNRQEIAGAIRNVIERFEPRLQDVSVVLLNPEEDLARQAVKFRVDARLAVDPFPDIAFDTILEMGSGNYSLSPASETS
jgi:type VI secretion system protein ImpF